jgi:hypothetical protein
MKPENSYWKLPLALGMVVCSFVPVFLMYCIAHVEYKYSVVWAHGSLPPPHIAWTFRACYRAGFILPVLTTVVAVWFVSGKFITVARLAWAILILVVLHLYWLSYGILAFYMANTVQKFNL